MGRLSPSTRMATIYATTRLAGQYVVVVLFALSKEKGGMSTEDRINPVIIDKIAGDLREVSPELSAIYILSCVAGKDISPSVAAHLPIGSLLLMYAEYLRGKGDYTPGTHNKDTIPEGIKEHIATYAKLHERQGKE
jgi:hypothetical protein